jgi:macrolide-specific efflux system membrane fusion protein
MTKPRSRPWYLYLLGVVAATVVALAVTEIGPPASSARTSTQIVTAEKGVVQSTVSGTGNVEAGTDLDVNFQASGTLSHVYVKVGQHVDKGQLLATLDQSAATLSLDQADENLTAAEDQLTSAQDSSTTTTTSSSSASGTSTTSAGSVASAQAAVDSAEASVQSAKTALADTSLYAPTSGTIVSMAGLSSGDSVSAGSTSSAGSSGTSSSSTASSGSGSGSATAGSVGSSSSSASTGASSSSGSSATPFAEIVNSKTMTMTVAFSESDISKIKVGQTATVTLDALSGVVLGARVTAISPLSTTSSSVVSYDATLTLDQSDDQVKPGMSASASVIVGQASGVNVPNSAVSGTGSLATVTLLSNGKQTKKQVAVGLRGDSRTEIVSGLNAGDQVVITTTLPALTSTTSTSSGGSGTLGGTGATFPGGGGGFGGGGRPGGLGGGAAAGGGA